MIDAMTALNACRDDSDANSKPLFDVVQAGSDDLTSVLAVDQQSFLKTDWWNEDLWRGFLKSTGSRVLLARSKVDLDPILGVVVFERGGKLMKIAVVPSGRCCGVGAGLLGAALFVLDGEFRRSCCSLHVEPTNSVAIKLYTRRGFKQDCVVCDYYGPGRHAWRMLRERCDDRCEGVTDSL